MLREVCKVAGFPFLKSTVTALVKRGVMLFVHMYSQAQLNFGEMHSEWFWKPGEEMVHCLEWDQL